MHQFAGKMSTLAGGEADVAVKPGVVLPDIAAPCFPGIPPDVLHPAPPQVKQPPAQPKEIHRNYVSVL